MPPNPINARVSQVIRQHRDARPRRNELASCNLLPFAQQQSNPLYQGKGKNRDLVVKFCFNPANAVPDIYEREHFVSLIGKVLDIPVVDAWIVKTRPLKGIDLPATGEACPLLRDRCIAMPLLEGEAALDNPSHAKEIVQAAPERIGDLFAFLHWIGDEDRGLKDIMLVEDKMVLIDNGLCGPGRNGILRGSHPLVGDYCQHPHSMVLMCYWRKPSFVAFVLHDLQMSALAFRQPAVLTRIKELPDRAIQRLVRETGLTPWVADVLILRRDVLDASYTDWLARAAQVCAY
jgi:hypothetical protein